MIGVQKSATTSVQHFLHSHPGVMMPMGEVACFESPDYEHGRFESQLSFVRSKGDCLAGIKRPDLFPNTLAMRRLHRHAPQTKLLVILRNPIDRFVSAYFHLMNSGKIPVRNINRAVCSMFNDDYFLRHPAGLSLLHYGLYSDHLETIERLWGQERILALSHQRIAQQPSVVHELICEFLGLEPFEMEQTGSSWKNRGSYSYARALFLRPSNLLKYRFHSGRVRKEIRPGIVPRYVGGALSRLARQLPATSVNPKTVLDRSSRAALVEYFRADVTCLAERRPGLVEWAEEFE
ncbi:MAG: sulfotransferase domain-containing protein [Pseudomonadota bacterium]